MRLTVRLVCPSCQVVHEIQGEQPTIKPMTTREIGYGCPPRRVGGVWLYPGPPLLLDDTDPDGYLCALRRVDRLQPEDVVGCVGQGRGSRGGVVWGAAALPVVREAKFRPGVLFEYAVRSGDRTFRTETGAAKWVAAQVEEARQGRAVEGQLLVEGES